MFIKSFLKDHLLLCWMQPYCAIAGILIKRHHFTRSPPGHLTYGTDVHQECLLPRFAHWLTDGQYVGKVLIGCYSLGQAPGQLGCTQDYRRTCQSSTELVGWSSLMSGLLGIQQQQLRVGSKRPAHRIEEDFAWKVHCLNTSLLDMAFTQKRLLLNKWAAPTLFCVGAFALISVSISCSSRPKFQVLSSYPRISGHQVQAIWYFHSYKSNVEICMLSFSSTF